LEKSPALIYSRGLAHSAPKLWLDLESSVFLAIPAKENEMNLEQLKSQNSKNSPFIGHAGIGARIEIVDKINFLALRETTQSQLILIFTLGLFCFFPAWILIFDKQNRSYDLCTSDQEENILAAHKKIARHFPNTEVSSLINE